MDRHDRLRLFAAALAMPAALVADAQCKVSGLVTDTDGRPIDAAAVTVENAADSTVVWLGITAADGRFEAVAEGRVRVWVSCIGFAPHVSAPFAAERDTVLPPVRLVVAGQRLADVTVVGEKQTQDVTVERGKMTWRPHGSALASGTSALEVLKRLPGVTVDGNSRISLGGGTGVEVMLDGKRSYVQGDELVQLLRSVPSSSIEAVEVMRTPSAAYDAEGSGGIINIVTDRRRRGGAYVSLNNGVSYWENLRQNTELAFSYAGRRCSVGGNYSHAFGHYAMDYGMRRSQGGKDYYSPTSDTDKRKSMAGNIDFDFRINDIHSLSARVEANTLTGPGRTETVTEVRDAGDHRLESTLTASNDYYMQRGNRYGGNLHWEASPDEGTDYAADINYAWFDGGSGNLQPNADLAPDGTVLSDETYHSVNSRDIHIIAAAYDQRHRLMGGELRSGVKWSQVDASNSYRFGNASDGGMVVDEGRSSDFDYVERIGAAYLLYARRINDAWDFEVGLRGEITWSDAQLHTLDGTGDEGLARHYFDLFPTASVNYTKGRHSLSLNYSSRLDRPAYQDLNPFEYLLDELSYWKGNPFLMPQKTHKAALTYQYAGLAATASYSFTRDVKTQIADTLSTDKVVMMPRNIGKRQVAALDLAYSAKVTRWWELGVNLTGCYAKNDIAFDEARRFERDGFAGIVSLHNLLRLPWRIMMEVNGSYTTRRLGEANDTFEPTGYVDVSLSRSFADKRWTVGLAVTDLFWTSRWDNTSGFDGFSLYNWGKGESRQIKLNVTCRLGIEKRKSRTIDFNEIDRL